MAHHLEPAGAVFQDLCRILAHLAQHAAAGGTCAALGGQVFDLLPRQALWQRAAAAAEGDAHGLEGARVLMVEDNPVNMMIAVAMLERWGVEVAQAHNGSEAVAAVHEAAAASRPFDAVLMDVQMPVMSGHEATRALRAGVVGRDLPIIALTAAALVTERDEALAAGMNDFLTKPIDAERLHATLLRWCSRAGPAADQ